MLVVTEFEGEKWVAAGWKCGAGENGSTGKWLVFALRTNAVVQENREALGERTVKEALTAIVCVCRRQKRRRILVNL